MSGASTILLLNPFDDAEAAAPPQYLVGVEVVVVDSEPSLVSLEDVGSHIDGTAGAIETGSSEDHQPKTWTARVPPHWARRP